MLAVALLVASFILFRYATEEKKPYARFLERLGNVAIALALLVAFSGGGLKACSYTGHTEAAARHETCEAILDDSRSRDWTTASMRKDAAKCLRETAGLKARAEARSETATVLFWIAGIL